MDPVSPLRILTGMFKGSPISPTRETRAKNVAYSWKSKHEGQPIHIEMRDFAVKTIKDLKGESRGRESRRSSYDDAFSDNRAVKAGVDLHHQQFVRSHAFSNEKTLGMTMEGWMKQHSKKRADSTSPTKRRNRMVNNNAEFVEAVDSPRNICEETVFEAFYYASDDDYLMDAKVRAYFKENALESTDAILFALIQQPVIIPESEQESSEETYQNSHRLRGYVKYGVITYLVTSGLFLAFLVPPQLFLSALFILIGKCCFLL